MICGSCGPGRCVDKPGPASPALIDCPVCNGDPPPEAAGGCRQCGQEGRIEITDCPHKRVPRETDELIQLCEFARHGNLPVSGGTLDQTRWFLDAYQFYLAERSRLKQAKDPWHGSES